MGIRHVELSAPENTVMGDALFKLYYMESVEMISLLQTSGSPHNGGEHTFVVIGRDADIIAWLDLFVQKYPYVKQEIDAMKKELSISNKKFIRLKDLKRRGLDGLKHKWFRVDKAVDYFRLYGDCRLEGPNISAIPEDKLNIVCPTLKVAFLKQLIVIR